MKAVTIRLPEELIKEIKIICVKKDVTFQEAVRQGLELWKKDRSQFDCPKSPTIPPPYTKL